MYTGDYFLSNLFRAPHKCWNPIKPALIRIGSMPDYDSLYKSEYPKEFAECDKLAHNRMIMGSFRYGLIARQSLIYYNPANECIKRINRYLDDGNLEHLVDACNMIKLAFYRGKKFLGQKMFSVDDSEHAQPIL
jgi:hypothetical protein